MERVRIGLIGAGWVARTRHLPALKNTPEADLRLIWSRNLDKAREVAAEFGISTVASQWQEITASPAVDAVVIATPPVLHHTATLAALEAGKHVLCQARMARNLREAREMVHAAQGSGLVAALYPPRPGLKGDRVMRRLIREEHYVGEIREVRVTGMALTPQGDDYHWRTDPEMVGVNTMTLGLWAEVLHRWVGPATRVMAMAQVHRKQRKTPGGVSTEAVVPDSLAVIAELQCGATASYHFSEVAAFGPQHFIEIYGSRGALVYQLFTEEIQGATVGDERLRPIPIPPEEERFQDTDARFVQAILQGTPVSPDFDEGLRYMEFCEAVALSVKKGVAVPLPLPQATMETWDRFTIAAPPTVAP
jgi:predicted dehydrogenase